MTDKPEDFDPASISVERRQELFDVLFDAHIAELRPLKRAVSGTYKSLLAGNTMVELRVDVDNRRPQHQVSGDVYAIVSIFGSKIPFYQYSFVAATVTTVTTAGEVKVSGAIQRLGGGAAIGTSIEVKIPRVSIFAAAPSAALRFITGATENASFSCPKTSEYFRSITLEIDRFTSTNFPAAVDTGVSPHPANLTVESLDVRTVFRRSGIDLTVVQDDVLSDSDGSDDGTFWSKTELHDLMETRFDLYKNYATWNVYGVVVPRFGENLYESGLYGVMFDWGGYQVGDTRLRQGFAIAEDAIEGRGGALYDAANERGRLILQTFIHELGHACNLPHAWQRSGAPNAASNSFMNYPWGYTGGVGGESAFWGDFRWQFDDVEVAWMRHADRADLMFGGRDWIGNNLSLDRVAAVPSAEAPVALRLDTPDVIELGEPLYAALRLQNTGPTPGELALSLDPEDGQMVFYIERPDHSVVVYSPPVRRCGGAPPVRPYAPGATAHRSVLLSYASWGQVFTQPGEYRLRACGAGPDGSYAASNVVRLRVAAPAGREAERLSHLMLAPETARFVYLGGSTRFPGHLAQLEEAARRAMSTSPALTRHLRAALGTYHARALKVVSTDAPRRVRVRSPDLAAAASHFEAARSGVADEAAPVFDNATYRAVSEQLAEVYLRSGRPSEAARTLAQTARVLGARGAPAPTVRAIEARAEELSRARDL